MRIPSSLTLEDFKKLTIEDVFQSVANNRQKVTVSLEGGFEVVIQPKPGLRPLPVFKGFVPQGWKEAIYDEPK